MGRINSFWHSIPMTFTAVAVITALHNRCGKSTAVIQITNPVYGSFIVLLIFVLIPQ
jgi:uncharacterized protein YqhQ